MRIALFCGAIHYDGSENDYYGKTKQAEEWEISRGTTEMGRGKQKKERKIDINILGTIMNTILFLQSFQKDKISEALFRWVITIALIIAVLSAGVLAYKIAEEIKEHRKWRKKLDKEAEKSDKAAAHYRRREVKMSGRFKRRCKKRFLNSYFLHTIIAIILICIGNPQNTKAYWKDVKSVFLPKETGGANRAEGEEIPEEKEEKDSAKNTRNIEWRFILDNPAGIFTLDGFRESQVFFCSDDQTPGERNAILKTMEQWQENPKEGVPYLEITDVDGNTYHKYMEDEDMFKEEVERASQYTDYEEWLIYAPHSSEMDEYILGRDNLNQVKVDDKVGSYEVWWRRANDDQYYAEEYEAQTENESAVLYYYANSIYCCMESLKYSISQEQYSRTYHYMVMRYHDLCRDECIVSEEYKDRAEYIFGVLVESDVLYKAGME